MPVPSGMTATAGGGSSCAGEQGKASGASVPRVRRHVRSAASRDARLGLAVRSTRCRPAHTHLQVPNRLQDPGHRAVAARRQDAQVAAAGVWKASCEWIEGAGSRLRTAAQASMPPRSYSWRRAEAARTAGCAPPACRLWPLLRSGCPKSCAARAPGDSLQGRTAEGRERGGDAREFGQRGAAPNGGARQHRAGTERAAAAVGGAPLAPGPGCGRGR